MKTARIFSYFLDDAVMWLLSIIFLIIDADKQDFSCIIFKRLHVLPVLNLLYRCTDTSVIFEFHYNCRFVRARQWQKCHICKAFPSQKLAYQFIILSRAIIRKANRASKCIFIIIRQD